MTEPSVEDAPEKRTDEKAIETGPTIVGLGASAGGLEALGQFFAAVPADTGMVFVVVTHLYPGRVSLMPELLQRQCALPISQVDEPTKVEPDHVYMGPPGKKLVIDDGVLSAKEPIERARALPIDAFFRSLAFDQRERAVGIVLSGTGTDGTIGIKEIKGASGMTMAQEESSARYAGMPHSAIAGLQVDYVLPPQEMVKKLVAYTDGARKRVQGRAEEPAREAQDALNRIFVLLRSRTRHDFSHYKLATIRRRIERRMNVHQIEKLGDYAQFVQKTPQELDELFKELLIGVTSFFRDPDAFAALERHLGELLENKPLDHVLRAWVPGCSTGEEAYSLAMLLKETTEKLKRHVGIQVFATDLDSEAIEIARAGEYPESITADVTPPRLQRFFTQHDGIYRVRKEVREMIVFAPQNVIEDPPFTKLDILSCRNLLIYLDAKLQQRLLPLFHYALRPGGILFLGSSETVGSVSQLFTTLDKKWKVYRRKEVPVGSYVPDLTVASRLEGARRQEPDRLPLPRSHDLSTVPPAERAILNFVTPPSVVIHERGDIVHIHGRTGLFLEPSPGPQATANIYNMAREGLATHIAIAVRAASNSDDEIVHRDARVKTNGHEIGLDLRVRRLTRPESLAGLYLVAFDHVETIEPPAPGESARPVDEVRARLSDLERELQHTKEVHQGTVEELETANEELKSTNEELQSTNEELQSTNEELETSKEEMQSLNEELQTVNAELQGKLEALSRANDDMRNLLNGTDIATVFLDDDLNIKRFTEQTTRVIHLIPSDVGRPIGDLVSKLNYTKLIDDAREVLRTLAIKEAELRSDDGTWYLMRILPYRTIENMIDGLVLTFVDITRVKHLQEEARRIVAALRQSRTSVFAQTRILEYSWVFGPFFGRQAEEIIGCKDADLVGERDAKVLDELKRRVLEKKVAVRERMRLTVGGESKVYELFLAPASSTNGETGITGTVTELDGEALG